jgi:hypothetical protein
MCFCLEDPGDSYMSPLTHAHRPRSYGLDTDIVSNKANLLKIVYRTAGASCLREF